MRAQVEEVRREDGRSKETEEDEAANSRVAYVRVNCKNTHNIFITDVFTEASGLKQSQSGSLQCSSALWRWQYNTDTSNAAAKVNRKLCRTQEEEWEKQTLDYKTLISAHSVKYTL